MYKIGYLTKKFNISRTALLYYDDIGLLKPSGRTKANYRLYNDNDIKRLELICMYKDMGIELKDIKKILDEKTDNKKMLEAVLIKLDNDIKAIKGNQQKILTILQNTKHRELAQANIFSDIIDSLGIDRKEFHMVFEKKDTQGHKEFLEFLGFTSSEIEDVIRHLKE